MESSAQNRSSWLMSTLSLTAAPIIYYVVGLQVAHSMTPAAILPTVRLVAIPLAVVLLAIGARVIRGAPRAASTESATDPVGPLATPERFLFRFMVGAALIEASAVMGFVLLFLGAPVDHYLPFGAGTLVMMAAVALPTGLGYWSERERAGPGGSVPLS